MRHDLLRPRPNTSRMCMYRGVPGKNMTMESKAKIPDQTRLHGRPPGKRACDLSHDRLLDYIDTRALLAVRLTM
jgi:hypothetical protein